MDPNIKRLSDYRGVLVDSNVLLDVATNDPVWGDWSARSLAEIAEHTVLVINPIIYAEVSIGYTTIEALDFALPTTLYQREHLPWEAGFLAGKCFLRYRRSGAPEARLCRISILERTLPLDTWPCSRAMLRAIGAIFRDLSYCHRRSAGSNPTKAATGVQQRME